MKLKVKRTVLLEALNNVSKAISTKNIIPILSGIKFDLFKDKLVLTFVTVLNFGFMTQVPEKGLPESDTTLCCLLLSILMVNSFMPD